MVLGGIHKSVVHVGQRKKVYLLVSPLPTFFWEEVGTLKNQKVVVMSLVFVNTIHFNWIPVNGSVTRQYL